MASKTAESGFARSRGRSDVSRHAGRICGSDLILLAVVLLVLPAGLTAYDPGQEFMIDSTYVLSAQRTWGPGEKQTVAYNGKWFLVTGYLLSNRMYRVDSDGVVLDTAGVSAGFYSDGWQQSLASDSHGFMEIATDQGQEHARVYVIDSLGRYRDSIGTVLPVISDGSVDYMPRVFFGCGNYLATWQQWDTILACRISPDGRVLDTAALQVGVNFAGGEVGFPASSNGQEYLVAWWNDIQRSVYGTRISADGRITTPGGFRIGPGNPRCLVWNGRHYIMAYEHDYRIRLGRLTPEGVLIDTVGPAYDWDEYSVATACHGTDILAAGVDRNGVSTIYHLIDSPSGLVADSQPVVVWTDEGDYREIAPGRDWFLAAWWTDRTSKFARISFDGRLLDTVPRVLTLAANEQTEPRAATDGQDYFFAWREQRGQTRLLGAPVQKLYGARLESDGNVIDSLFLMMDPAPREFRLSFLRRCLLVWVADSQVLGCRYNPDGGRVDPQPFRIGGPATAASVTHNGDDFLVAWIRERDVAKVARVSPELGLRDTVPIRIPQSGWGRLDPCSNGNDFLVAWLANGIVGVRVSAAGRLLDTVPVQIVPAGVPSSEVLVSFDGRSFLLATCEGHQVVHCWRATPDLVLLDSTPVRALNAAPDGIRELAMTFDGRNYVIAAHHWSDDWVGMVRVTPEGVLLDSQPLTISPPEHLAKSIGLVSAGGGKALCYYYRWVSERFDNNRVFGCLIDEDYIGVGEQHAAKSGVRLMAPSLLLDGGEIVLQLVQVARIGVRLYDAAGRMQAELLPVTRLAAGEHRLPVKTNRLSSGIYFIRAEPTGAVRKVTVSR